MKHHERKNFHRFLLKYLNLIESKKNLKIDLTLIQFEWCPGVIYIFYSMWLSELNSGFPYLSSCFSELNPFSVLTTYKKFLVKVSLLCHGDCGVTTLCDNIVCWPRSPSSPSKNPGVIDVLHSWVISTFSRPRDFFVNPWEFSREWTLRYDHVYPLRSQSIQYIWTDVVLDDDFVYITCNWFWH